MAAPGQALDIINLALLQLYQAPVTNLADLSNTVAQIANTLYDQCRRSILRNFIWNFAKKRGQAVLSPTVPLYDYLNAYQIPNDPQARQSLLQGFTGTFRSDRRHVDHESLLLGVQSVHHSARAGGEEHA